MPTSSACLPLATASMCGLTTLMARRRRIPSIGALCFDWSKPTAARTGFRTPRRVSPHQKTLPRGRMPGRGSLDCSWPNGAPVSRGRGWLCGDRGWRCDAPRPSPEAQNRRASRPDDARGPTHTIGSCGRPDETRRQESHQVRVVPSAAHRHAPYRAGYGVHGNRHTNLNCPAPQHPWAQICPAGQ